LIVGGGKSFFLDQLGNLNHDDINQFCSHPEMKTILKNSVAVAITYNSATVFNLSWDCVPVYGLALRTLFRYLLTKIQCNIYKN
jgi:hypothetical protein